MDCRAAEEAMGEKGLLDLFVSPLFLSPLSQRTLRSYLRTRAMLMRSGEALPGALAAAPRLSQSRESRAVASDTLTIMATVCPFPTRERKSAGNQKAEKEDVRRNSRRC